VASNSDGTLITITNSTITGNTAKFGGGGMKIDGGTLKIQNTIIKGNTARSGPDIIGAVESLGNNLVGNTSRSTGLLSSDLKNIDPKLGPLADNGGATLTHALLAGSPAIDAGNNSGAPSTDQRGVVRPIDGDSDETPTVDIGAVEYKPLVLNATVNSTADTVDANLGDRLALDADGKTTLRAAIMEANALGGAAIITLPAATYTLTIAGAGEDNSATGDLDIKSDVTIVGAGTGSTIINGSALDRVLDISADVVLRALTVTNGRPPGPGQKGNGYGGGIAINSGTVVLDQVAVSGNHGAFGTGGIAVNGGNLTITGSTVSGNSTPYAGGGILVWNGGTANIINTTISGNSADNGGGVASNSDGTLITITNSTITGNTAKFGGGGMKIDGGTLKIQNTIVYANQPQDILNLEEAEAADPED
jgi:hypothetical protein